MKMNSEIFKRILKYGYSLITYPFVKLYYKDEIPVIKNDIQTLEYIKENFVSVSRFGDGELNLIDGSGNHFTKYNKALADRLKEVLKGERVNHIVCLPPQINSLKCYRLSQKLFWSWHLTWKLGKWVKLLKKDLTYYSAFISRFYLCYLNPNYTKCIINHWKQIWDNKDILIVEGEYTRLGVGNDLFNNVKSIKRILCPNENAFDKYEEILNESKRYKNHLILIALGQTATVLAYDLSIYDCWAIDIGHLDIEYEWYLKGVRNRVPIMNKYTNEIRHGDSNLFAINDIEYNKQIICKIL